MIRYLRPISVNRAEGLTLEIYKQIEREFGAVVEPFTLHSPAPRLLAGVWAAARETEVAGPLAPRKVKEAVALGVSNSNQCLYCVDAHSIMLDAAGGWNVSAAVRENTLDQLDDSALRNVVQWTAATRFQDSAALGYPPFDRARAPEMIGTAVFYHYINRMASVFLGKTPLPSTSKTFKKPLVGVAGLFFSFAAHRAKVPGDSLRFLPEAPLPGDLAWAQSSPAIAGAFARLAAIIQELGQASLPESVRSVVEKRLKTWTGKPFGLFEMDNLVASLDKHERPIAKLALLTATSPQQVTSLLVEEYCNRHPDPVHLLGALAWSSFSAARRIGSWLAAHG